MSNEVETDEISNHTGETTDKPVDKGRSTLGLWLSVLIALAAIGLSLMSYFQVGKLKMDTDRLVATLEPVNTQVSNLENALAVSRQERQGLEGQLAGLQQQQSAMAEDLQTLFKQQNTGNSDWVLAEIEYLLVVATHSLQLEHNVTLAIAAMQAADDRIKNSHDPGLLPVRQQLAADINTLQTVAAVDISGLVLFLSDLAGRVVDLPLQGVAVSKDLEQEKPQEEYSGTWDRLLATIWQELKSLVQVSRQGEETLATLIPDQQYFLYQNLRLQLESARYAVLRRDTDNLHVSVAFINTWLNDYFDVSDNGVANIIESMSQMATLELNPALPDISSSLESLRAYGRAQELPSGTDGEKILEQGQ